MYAGRTSLESPANHTMVPVSITLEQKEDAWYIVAYTAVLRDERHLTALPPPPVRKFTSQSAASNYVGRLVLHRLRGVNPDANGLAITWRSVQR